MCDAPAFWNIKIKQFRQLGSRLTGDVVAPGSKRDQQLIFFIKWHIAVHHGTDTDCTDLGQRQTIFFMNFSSHLGIAGLNTFPDLFYWIGPDMMIQFVFPYVIATGNRREIIHNQDRFDTRRS